MYRGKTMWGHREKAATHRTRKSTLLTLWSQTSSLQNCEKIKFLLFKPPSLQYFIMAALANSYSTSATGLHLTHPLTGIPSHFSPGFPEFPLLLLKGQIPLLISGRAVCALSWVAWLKETRRSWAPTPMPRSLSKYFPKQALFPA